MQNHIKVAYTYGMRHALQKFSGHAASARDALGTALGSGVGSALGFGAGQALTRLVAPTSLTVRSAFPGVVGAVGGALGGYYLARKGFAGNGETDEPEEKRASIVPGRVGGLLGAVGGGLVGLAGGRALGDVLGGASHARPGRVIGGYLGSVLGGGLGSVAGGHLGDQVGLGENEQNSTSKLRKQLGAMLGLSLGNMHAWHETYHKNVPYITWSKANAAM